MNICDDLVEYFYSVKIFKGKILEIKYENMYLYRKDNKKITKDMKKDTITVVIKSKNNDNVVLFTYDTMLYLNAVLVDSEKYQTMIFKYDFVSDFNNYMRIKKINSVLTC